MITINIGISADKKVVSMLSIALDDSDSRLGEIDVESVIAEVHAKMWRYVQTWSHQNIAIMIKSEVVE